LSYVDQMKIDRDEYGWEIAGYNINDEDHCKTLLELFEKVRSKEIKSSPTRHGIRISGGVYVKFI